MKCLLLILAKFVDVHDNKAFRGECLTKDCAWWHEYKDNNGTTHSACAIQHIAEAVSK